jgi:hypothetical protein
LKLESTNRKKTKIVLASIICSSITCFSVGYFAGVRLSVWTPSNWAACSDQLDRPAGYTPTPRTQQEQQDFEKFCPEVFWGEWTLTLPSKENGVQQVFVGQFWRPYWGYVWPDNNLGKFAPVQQPKN